MDVPIGNDFSYTTLLMPDWLKKYTIKAMQIQYYKRKDFEYFIRFWILYKFVVYGMFGNWHHWVST